MEGLYSTYEVSMIMVISLAAVLLVLGWAIASIFLISAIKSIVILFLTLLWFLLEVCTALIAAICSGTTVTLAMVGAAATASMTLPPSSIQGRIIVSMFVSCSAISASAAAMFYFLPALLAVNLEIVGSLIGAAAVAVGGASAWAVGIMSLLEKETKTITFKITSILDAVRYNRYNLLKVLLKLQSGLKKKDLNLALINAVKGDYLECVEILLSYNADPNCRDFNRNTPLIIACESGSIPIVKLLLDLACDPDKKNSSRVTALHYAAKWGHEECVELLISHGADTNVQDGHWMTPLMLACSYANPAENVMSILLQAECDVNICGVGDKQAIHYAAARGIDVGPLLKAGADPLQPDTDGNTPLHHASMDGSTQVIYQLLQAGANPHRANNRGLMCLHLASETGDLRSIETLLNAGADYNIPDSSGYLPIWHAAANGRFFAVRFFIIKNCPVKPYYRSTELIPIANPLLVALEKKFFPTVKILAIAGCDTKALSDWMIETPEDCWWESNIDVIHWLRDYLNRPVELAHSCRLSIRLTLRDDLLSKTQQLPLPKALQKFIIMEDLDEDIQQTKFHIQ